MRGWVGVHDAPLCHSPDRIHLVVVGRQVDGPAVGLQEHVTAAVVVYIDIPAWSHTEASAVRKCTKWLGPVTEDRWNNTRLTGHLPM